jgi:SAM-dependent methyltransferase
MASRRTERIDAHVAWIHQTVLAGRPTKVLDLACGPGLYTHRLAKLGHECVGVDFAPAAVEYAREVAEREQLACTYQQADVRSADFGDGFGLAMMISGQLNVFERATAADILRRARAALAADGVLLLELQTVEHVKTSGSARPSWWTAEESIFSDRPHLVLKESFWDADAQAGTDRYYVIDTETGRVARHALSNEAYTTEALESLLAAAGFRDVRFFPSLTGVADPGYPYNLAVVAQKRTA